METFQTRRAEMKVMAVVTGLVSVAIVLILVAASSLVSTSGQETNLENAQTLTEIKTAGGWREHD